MMVDAPGLGYLPLLVWIAFGIALGIAYRRGASTLVFRLAALFLAAWALLATTAFVWVVANGGGPALLRLASSPLMIFDHQFFVLWLIGGAGAFGVFCAAFLLSQTVDRAFLRVLRTRELPWPERLPRPPTATTLLAFPSSESDAFMFTLLERTGPTRLACRDVILVSEGLLSHLTDAEWEAVVAHELGHGHELDGRYLTFFRTFARMMRWDPVLAFLADSLTRREEYRADLDAVEATGRPRALARALYKASLLAPARRSARPGLLGVAGRRGRRETLERIRRLVALAESGRFPEERGA